MQKTVKSKRLMLNDFFLRDVSFIEQIEEAYQLASSKFGLHDNNKEIDKILSNVKQKNFDHKIFKNQKLSLIKDYEESLNRNYFWINTIIRSERSNENIERIVFYKQIINQITLKFMNQYLKNLMGI